MCAFCRSRRDSELTMDRPTGVHHLAVMSADIKKHLAFFTEVIGCPLVALFDMHGVEGGLHAFMQLNAQSYFSVVQLPAAINIPIEVGRTHSGTGEGACAPGTLQHLAFNVDTLEDLRALRDRIRSHGVNVIGPVAHGFCESIYFAGPDQLTLEVACNTETPMTADRWIDPKVVALAGISAEELERFTSPASYTGPRPVPQPDFDAAKPHQTFAESRYAKMLRAPDEVIYQRSQFTEPPVPASSSTH